MIDQLLSGLPGLIHRLGVFLVPVLLTAGALGLAVTLAVALRVIRQSTRVCRWQRQARRRGELAGWTCATCGEEGWSAGRSRPKRCLRGLRVKPL